MGASRAIAAHTDQGSKDMAQKKAVTPDRWCRVGNLPLLIPDLERPPAIPPPAACYCLPLPRCGEALIFLRALKQHRSIQLQAPYTLTNSVQLVIAYRSSDRAIEPYM